MWRLYEELSMLDQHRSIQSEETKEGRKEAAGKAEDAKGKSSLGDVRKKGGKRWRKNCDMKRGHRKEEMATEKQGQKTWKGHNSRYESRRGQEGERLPQA